MAWCLNRAHTMNYWQTRPAPMPSSWQLRSFENHRSKLKSKKMDQPNTRRLAQRLKVKLARRFRSVAKIRDILWQVQSLRNERRKAQWRHINHGTTLSIICSRG